MELRYFLGANSYQGFISLYEPYIRDIDPVKLYVLKGGAGCGKSGFMRRIAEQMDEAGLETHRILCSGDPDSLDGIYIKPLRTAFFDGTAPHVLEPKLVGQVGFYIDLSRFYRQEASGLAEYEQAYREHYQRAYKYLDAVGKLDGLTVLSDAAVNAIQKRADTVIRRECRHLGKEPGKIHVCFTDAFTGQGLLQLTDTRKTLCSRLIRLQGTASEAGVFLSRFQDKASALGYTVISCPDPLCPDRLSHVLLPQLGLGITTGEGSRTIHLERLIRSLSRESERTSRKEVDSLTAPLLHRAIAELRLARRDHDLLEAQVNPLVDFDQVYLLADQYAEKLLN